MVVSQSNRVEQFIRTIGPYVNLCLDFDDTLGDTEIVVAEVTARLVNPFLIAAGVAPLTAKDVCIGYSGLSFALQIEKLTATYGVTFPSELKKQKKQENLMALAKGARPLPGSEQVITFIIDYGLKAIVLTSADPERSNISLKRSGHDKYLTTSPELEADKIPVVSIDRSSGQTRFWKGLPMPDLPPKPDPSGPKYVASLLGADPSQVMGWEDSAPGMIANDLAGFGALAVISLSRRCKSIPDHVASLTKIIRPQEGRQVVVVNQSWAPAIKAALALGLKNAHQAGMTDLPAQLPDEVIQWIDNAFHPLSESVSLS